MKVAYFIPQFPKISETFIRREVEAIAAMGGIDIKVFSFAQEGSRGKFFRLWDTWVFFLNRPLFFAKMVFDFRQTPKAIVNGCSLAGEMAKFSPDLIFVHFISWPADLGAVLSRILNRPWGISAHARDIFLSSASDLERRIGRATFVATCTEFNHQYLNKASRGRFSHKIFRIYHGLDKNLFADAAPRRGNNPPFILSVGRLVEKKGFPYLLRALEILHRRGVPFRCQIVGEGPLRSELEKMAGDLGLSDLVRFVGSISFDEVKEKYLEANIFALPCLRTARGDVDGLPNVILEASLSGLPVVSTTVSGVPEGVRDGETGFLVEEKNAPALADALEKLILNPDLRQRMGEQGKEFVSQNFDLPKNVARLVALFEEVYREFKR